MRVDYLATGRQASLFIDDKLIGGGALPDTFPAPSDASIYLGVSFLSGSTKPWTLGFDDYVLTAN